ncbi:MAG: fused MFS/spermidine synthase [Pseudomonadota bacterium]
MILYAATILVSSFLLFLVQPIIAKQILPWFGGSAAVWTTCLVFFQLALLGGYAYSDFSNRVLKHRTQSTIHIVLLLASLAALPIVAATGWKPAGNEDPLWRILGLLLATIGLPYFMLSTTAPLIQSWFAREHADPKTAQRVYRFFALSNLGAILGLLAYPFAIEMWVSTRTQAIGWSIGYALFALLCIGSAWRARRLTDSADPSEVPKPLFDALPVQPPGSRESSGVPIEKDYLLWFILAALASMMLLAVTNHITQNVASIPFMWVLPLTLYLITFVLCFEGRGGRGFYVRKYWLPPTLIAICLMAWGITAKYGFLEIDIAIPLYCAGLFLVCMFCHGELAAAKPAARYLTRFYLILSLGGAAGGMFVGLLAPYLFTAYWELPLGLAALALMALLLTLHYLSSLGQRPAYAAAPLAALVSMAAAVYYAYDYNWLLKEGGTIHSVRNFYGRLSVKQLGYSDTSPETHRILMHGTIVHGKEYIYAPYRRITTSYYTESSGIGLALSHIHQGQPRRIGGVGMGVGTIAAYGRQGDLYKFYEINPKVIGIASNYFYYLNESPAQIQIALGDARLVLERERPQQFDVLAIDAFSGDAVPVHLVTREALAVYLNNINPDGAVAFHVTSRYLSLAPVIKQLADEAGYEAVLVADRSDDNPYASHSDWVIVTRNRDFLADPEVMKKRVAIKPIAGMKIWTDDFSNLFQILK